MDPILNNDDIFEVIFRARSIRSNSEILNVFHYRTVTAAVPPTEHLSDALSVILPRWTNNVVTQLGTDYEMVRADLKRMSGAVNMGTGWRWTYDSGVTQISGTTGTRVAPFLPQHVTASVYWRTGYLGRNWRGGSRLSPIATVDQDAANYNQLDAAYKAVLAASLGAFSAPVLGTGGNTYRLVVASLAYYVDVIGGGGPVRDAVADIIGYDVNPYFRTQNSRQAPHVP